MTLFTEEVVKFKTQNRAPGDHDKMLEEFKSCRIFYFPDNNQLEKWDSLDGKFEHTQLLDTLPFDNCVFEISSPKRPDLKYAAFVFTTSPGVYECIFFTNKPIPKSLSHANSIAMMGEIAQQGLIVDTNTDKFTVIGSGRNGYEQSGNPVTENEKRASLNGFHLLMMCLQFLNHKDVVLGKPRARNRVKLTKDYQPRIRDLVIIPTKRLETKKNPQFLGKPIEYSHRFEVRGHWRRLKHPLSLGKDRQGGYRVQGRTWVKACEKGKGELVVKRRMFQAQSSRPQIP